MPRDHAAYNAYQAEYQLRRYHARRKESIEILGGQCNYCGSTDDLQIDHIDRYKKSIKLSTLWSISRARYLEELKKCQALCESCHKGKTSIESSVEHGGGIAGKRNCDCEPCKTKKAEYMKTYMQGYDRKR